MKLAQALARIDPSAVRRVAHEALADVEGMSSDHLRAELETTIRSLHYVQPRVLGRLPPAFSILQCLLDSPQRRLGTQELRVAARAHSDSLTRLVSEGEIVASEEHRLYRRVLVAAWHTGQSIDPSEMSLLGVLRSELGLHFVDHFLVLHHPDFWAYWRREDAVERELANLMGYFIVVPDGGELCVPDELQRPVLDALGTPLTACSLRRVFEGMTTSTLVEALKVSDLAVAGSKADRIERLVQRMLPARVALESMSIVELQEFAEKVGCAKSGSKDSVISRLVDHFFQGRDIPNVAPEEPLPEIESKTLDSDCFAALFGTLTGRELTSILEKHPELVQSGSKSERVCTLWNSRYCERTLLSALQNRQLEDVLERRALRLGGSKAERISRLIESFRVIDSSATVPTLEG